MKKKSLKNSQINISTVSTNSVKESAKQLLIEKKNPKILANDEIYRNYTLNKIVTRPVS